MANRKNYQYTCEQPAIWSPMNANLQMQGIKVRHLLESLMMMPMCVQVVTSDPLPEDMVTRPAGGAEDTLLLLNIFKGTKREEMKKAKVI